MMNTRPLYLGGAWVASETTLRVHNPANGGQIGEVCTVGRPEVAKAIGCAHAALPAWRALTGRERGERLRSVADHLGRRRDEIARTITLENGKPLAQSLGEVAISIDHLLWFAEEARRAYGRVIPPQAQGKRHLVVKTPIGVVAAISPWNFPLMLAVRKVAPALAAGCPVVLKPASATPLSALLFAECVEAAGLPAGVFQVVLGHSAEIADEFLENALCRKITFTGSTEVGQLLIRGASRGVKPLSLELGGHAPVLVFSDADLNQAVETVMTAKFRNSGQSCIAANRIYVQKPVYEPFLAQFTKRTRDLKVGDGLEEGVQVGPVINQQGLDKALEHIADARNRGARCLCGGGRMDRPGWFIEPTVLADVPEGALCMKEETFAPVAPVCSFETEEEGVQRANASPFGLSAYVCTRDLGRTFRLIDVLEAGTIAINEGAPATSQCPFGGLKHSGWGRELGSEGLEAFLETKHVSILL
jgi:succinate-semialdehyde dehydrogenase/glutarate-semialdehyde dehydrogenase